MRFNRKDANAQPHSAGRVASGKLIICTKNSQDKEAKKLLAFFFHRDFERTQELLILRGQADLAARLDVNRAFGIVRILSLILVPLVEADSRFEDEEHIIAGSLDFADGTRNAI